MSKTAKRFVSLVLVLALCLCLGVSAFADGTVSNVMGGFPQQQTTNYTAGYTGVIQRALYVYSDSTKDEIVSGGGIDGIYGYYTMQAVVIYQGECGLFADGIFGVNSWSSLGQKLSYHATVLGYDQYYLGSYVVVSLGNMGSSGYVTTGTTWYRYKLNGVTNAGYNTTSSDYWAWFRTEG